MCGVWPLGPGPRWETHPGLFCLPARVGGVGGGVVLAWGTAACGCLVGAAACGRGPCGVCVGGVLVLWLPVWWSGVGGGMLSGSGTTHRPGPLVLMIVSWAWLLACGGRVVVLLVWLLPAPVRLLGWGVGGGVGGLVVNCIVDASI